MLQHPVIQLRLCARAEAERMINRRPLCERMHKETEQLHARVDGEGERDQK